MPHHARHRYRRSAKKKNQHIVLNQLVMAVAVIEPLMTIPQLYDIWIRHETAGVSIATWAFFALAAGIWLVYGVTLKNLPIIISSTLWVLLETAIVIGLLIY